MRAERLRLCEALTSHPFLGEGAAPLSPTCVCGVTLQCPTVFTPVPQCGLQRGWRLTRILLPGPPTETGTDFLFLPHLPGNRLWWLAVPSMPCGISMSYWQPHNSGKGVPGGGGQAGSTEGPCPAHPPGSSSHAASPMETDLVSSSSHCPTSLRVED